MNKFINIFGKYLCYLLLAISLCACSKEESELLTSDFTYAADPSEPGVIKFINNSKGASTSLWDFGDGRGQSYGTNPNHRYYSNDTFQVTLTTFSSANSNGKLPGKFGGLGKKSTKQVIVTNAQPIFSANLTANNNAGNNFTFSGIFMFVERYNNTISFTGYDRNYDFITLRIPASATAGSTYSFNPQQSTSSNGYLSSTIFKNQYYAHDTSCPGSYGTITITDISSTHIKGTFSGKLYTYNYANCGPSTLEITNGEINF